MASDEGPRLQMRDHALFGSWNSGMLASVVLDCMTYPYVRQFAFLALLHITGSLNISISKNISSSMMSEIRCTSRCGVPQSGLRIGCEKSSRKVIKQCSRFITMVGITVRLSLCLHLWWAEHNVCNVKVFILPFQDVHDLRGGELAKGIEH